MDDLETKIITNGVSKNSIKINSESSADFFKPAPKSKRARGIFIFLVLILAAAAAWFFAARTGKKYVQTQTTVKTAVAVPVTYTIKDVAGGLPNYFPADFPLEQGAVILNKMDLSGTAHDGSELDFMSVKTVDQDYRLYHDYFSGLGWTEKIWPDSVALPQGAKEFRMVKPGLQVTVYAGPYKQSSQTEVDVNFQTNNIR